jgi:DNA-binding ferritin-like protein
MNELLNTYSEVSWSAYPENVKAVRSYTIFTNRHKGVIETVGDHLRFTVRGSDTLASSNRAVHSALEDKESASPEPTIAGLADLVNAVQNDIHWLHFNAADSEEGSVGHWDRIHSICNDYYTQLIDEYDSIAELSLQVGEDLTHPNESASVIGFSNTEASLENGITYSRAMQVLFRELKALTSYASRLDDLVGNKYPGADGKGISNYLQDFIQRWSKEQNYKTMRRLNSSYSGLFSGTTAGNITPEDHKLDPSIFVVTFEGGVSKLVSYIDKAFRGEGTVSVRTGSNGEWYISVISHDEKWVCKLFANADTRKVRIETLSHVYEDALNVLTDDRTAMQLASIIRGKSGRRL